MTAVVSARRAPLDVDAVNIALMLLSAALAFAAPVELFLFSYAVLGPLHYLTEIGWLHQRAYFLRRRIDALPLLALGVAAAALNWRWVDASSVIGNYGIQASAIGLLVALVFVTIRQRWLAALVIIGAYYALKMLRTSNNYAFWLLYMVPTLLHVFAFTLMFVIAGAIKSRKPLGLLSAVALVATAAATWFVRPSGIGHVAGRYAAESYAPFSGLNSLVLDHFDLLEPEAMGEIFSSPTGLALMRFIAFAYTYHYLNWFSKTRVISWHRIPKWQLGIVVILWGVSLAIYAQSYQEGLRVLFLLSFVHVLLEFPLNFRTAAGIGRDLVGPTWQRNVAHRRAISGSSSRPSSG